MYRLQSYDPKYIFSLTPDKQRHELFNYNVIISNSRINLFRKNNACVCCGIKGNRFILEFNLGPHERKKSESVPHLNFYANWNQEQDLNSNLILMTKDHIKSKVNGGKNEPSNYQTMCYVCNSTVKSNHDTSLPVLRIARKVYDIYGAKKLNEYWSRYEAHDSHEKNYSQSSSKASRKKLV